METRVSDCSAVSRPSAPWTLLPWLDDLERELESSGSSAPPTAPSLTSRSFAETFFEALRYADATTLGAALQRLEDLAARPELATTHPVWFGVVTALRAGARSALDRLPSWTAEEAAPEPLGPTDGSADAPVEAWFQWLGYEVSPSESPYFIASRPRSPVPDRWLVATGPPDAAARARLTETARALRDAGDDLRPLWVLDADGSCSEASSADLTFTSYDALYTAAFDSRSAADQLRRRLDRNSAPTVVEVDIRLDAPDGPRREMRTWFDEWLAGNERVLTVLGEFGSGKTTLCRRLAARLSADAALPLPVLISLREHDVEGFTLESLLARHFQREGIAVSHPGALLQSLLDGRLLLMLDGLGEWIARFPVERRSWALQTLLGAGRGRAKILLTSRTHDVDGGPRQASLLQALTRDETYRVVYLQDFDAAGVETFLRHHAPERAPAILELLADSEDLRDLASRPFMLRMVVEALPDLARKADLDLARLYESYCRQWLEPDAHEAQAETFERRRVAELAAFRLWAQGAGGAEGADGAESFDIAQMDAWLGPPPSGQTASETTQRAVALERALRRAPFLRRDGDGRFAFIHRSFQELFLARTVVAGLEAADPAVLNVPPFSRQSGFFMASAERHDLLIRMAGRVLEKPYRRRISENALLLLVFVARSRLASLSGSGAEDGLDERLAELPEVFASLRPAGLHLRGAELAGMELRGLDLASADLRGAVLDGADLRRCRLDASDLSSAGLRGADLRGARLEGTQLEETDLREADLRGADIRLARCARADFTGARIEGLVSSGAGFVATRGLPQELLSTTVGLRAVMQSGHSWRVCDVDWHPQLPLIASAAEDGAVLVWNASDERLLRRFSGHGRAVNAVAWDPSGRRLASGSDDRTVRIWDAETGDCQAILRGHTAGVGAVDWDGRGDRLVSASEDHTVRIWEPASRACLHVLEGHSDRVNTVSWEPGSERVASGSDDWTVRLWDASSGEAGLVLAGHSDGVHAVDWSPDGRRLASGSDDWTLRVWDPEDGRCTRTLSGHSEGIHAVAWHPQGRTLASGAFDRAIRLWDAEVGRAIDKLTGHTGWVRAVSWDPSGRRLASGASSRALRVWDVESRRSLHRLAGSSGWINTVAWTLDGRFLASGSSGRTVRIWDRLDGSSRALKGHEDRVHTVSWDPSGRLLASGADDRTVRVWDVRSGTTRHVLEGHAGWIRAVVWNPDGRFVASGADDRTVRIWDAESGVAVRTLEGHNGWVRALAWDPSDRFLASGADDGTVKLWQPETGQLMHTLGGHGAWVLSIAWSPDGDLLAAGTGDGQVFLWDPSEGRRLGTLLQHDSWVHTLAWSEDGKSLLSVSVDGSIRIMAPDGSSRAGVEARIEAGFVWHAAWRRGMLALAAPEGRIGLWRLAESAGPEGRDGRKVADLWGTPAGGLVITDDDRVDGDPVALERLRFVDNGWAVYEIDELPDRHHPEAVRGKLSAES